MLVPNAFQNLFFPPFGRQSAPKSRRIDFFGPLLAPPRIFRVPKKVPKIVQVSPKASKKVSRALTFWDPGVELMSGSVLQCSWAPILSILGRFLMNSDGFGHHFFEDFTYFSAGAFAECQRRLARNGITENFKNMEITADICKNQTHYLLSMHFWRPICKPLKPHATMILATQPADSCQQRR